MAILLLPGSAGLLVDSRQAERDPASPASEKHRQNAARQLGRRFDGVLPYDAAIGPCRVRIGRLPFPPPSSAMADRERHGKRAERLRNSRDHVGAPALATVIGLPDPVGAPRWPVALPLPGCWSIRPSRRWITCRCEKPSQLSPDQNPFCKNWRAKPALFRDTFVGPTTIAPDNFQEEPRPTLALRYPTNIGIPHIGRPTLATSRQLTERVARPSTPCQASFAGIFE